MSAIGHFPFSPPSYPRHTVSCGVTARRRAAHYKCSLVHSSHRAETSSGSVRLSSRAKQFKLAENYLCFLECFIYCRVLVPEHELRLFMMHISHIIVKPNVYICILELLIWVNAEKCGQLRFLCRKGGWDFQICSYRNQLYLLSIILHYLTAWV